jgi:membrane protein implicated in regulation of membrane protease activity
MAWWIWLLAGLVLVLIELLTPGGFYILFFGIGALVVGALAGFKLAGPPWMEWLLFSLLSLLALALLRGPLLARWGPRVQDREIDSLVGETALALEDIAVDGIGKVELRGAAWNARNAGEGPVSRGQRCRVEQVEGLTLRVRG